MDLCIWYIYYDNPNPNWKTPVSQAFNIALPRLENYFGTDWDYQFMGEFQTSVRYDKAIMPNKCIQAITELANSNPDFRDNYTKCELPFLVFANSTDAFIFDYKSPVWSSDDAFVREQEGLVIIEHEIGHTFGLPDHVKPWAKTYYENCMMGNPYVDSIQLCPECAPKFILSNYKKHPYSAIVNLPVKEEEPPVIIPQEPPEEPILPEPIIPEQGIDIPYLVIGGVAYAYWAGGIPQKMFENVTTWPSDREITCSFQVKNYEESSRTANMVVKFAGQQSNTLRIAPGQIGEVKFILQPLAAGLYSFSIEMIESGKQFGYETTEVNVIQSEPPIIPVYNFGDIYHYKTDKRLLTILVGSGIGLVGLARLVKGRKG